MCSAHQTQYILLFGCFWAIESHENPIHFIWWNSTINRGPGPQVTNASTVFPSWHLGSAGAAAPTSSWACLQPAASSEAISRWDQMTSYRSFLKTQG